MGSGGSVSTISPSLRPAATSPQNLELTDHQLGAALTVGSDVAVTTAPDSTTSLEPTLAQVPPVAAARWRRCPPARVCRSRPARFVPASIRITIGRAAPLRTHFTLGSSVETVLADLAKTPDGALLSQETLHDYQLHTGDLVRLRLRNQKGSLVTVPFQWSALSPSSRPRPGQLRACKPVLRHQDDRSIGDPDAAHPYRPAPRRSGAATRPHGCPRQRHHRAACRVRRHPDSPPAA